MIQNPHNQVKKVDIMLNRKKQLSLKNTQNFLKEKNLVSNLLEMTNISKEDAVIEIGGGKGIITEQLYKMCKKVYIIEYDYQFYRYLIRRFSNIENIEIVYGDFLKYKLPQDIDYKVVSSIPYNITSSIMDKLLKSSNPPQDIFLIIQKEAAEKYAGYPYGNESMRSLLFKPFFSFRIIKYIERSNFIPVPSVDSVFLHISKCKKALISNENINSYNDFISYVFTRNGKDIKTRCKKIFSHKQIKRLASDTGFKVTDSPIKINYEKWLKIFQYYIIGVAGEKKKHIVGSYKKLIKEQNKIEKIHRNRLK